MATMAASVYRCFWNVGETICQRFFSTMEAAETFSAIVSSQCDQLGIAITPTVAEVQVYVDT